MSVMGYGFFMGYPGPPPFASKDDLGKKPGNVDMTNGKVVRP